MRELAAGWYAILGTINAVVAGPLGELAYGTDVSLLSALVFGLIGATSPCQLTTGISAMAYVTSRSSDRGSMARNAAAYTLGKLLVYTLLGGIVILVGQQLAQGSIPAIVLVRKLIGPLMILLGLYMLGLVPLRFSIGANPSAWLENRARSGVGGAFLLGAAFAFAFCPTLFLLFFGLTIPLALASPIGVVYPAVFALGTTLPLLVVAGLFLVGFGTARGRPRTSRRLGAWIGTAAAIVLLLAGVSDTLTYWFL